MTFFQFIEFQLKDSGKSISKLSASARLKLFKFKFVFNNRWIKPFSRGGESIKDDRYPIQKYLEVATGILGFSPNTFWGMTQREFTSALEGYLTKHGKGGRNSPVLEDEMKELMERFPD